MRYLSFLLFLCFGLSFFRASGQDIIVTVNNDTIHCKIDRLDERFVYYFTENTKRGEYELISRKIVSSVQNEVEPVSKIIERKALLGERGYEVFQIFGSGGISQLAILNQDEADEFKEYNSQLSLGAFFEMGANYFINKNLGFGLVFTNSVYRNSIDVINTMTMATGKLEDDIRLQYFGLNVAYRIPLRKGNSQIQLNGGFGLMTYRNFGKLIDSYTLTGNGGGTHISGSYLLSLGPNVYIPISISIRGFAVSNLEIDFGSGFSDEDRESIQIQLEDNPALNVTRIELGIGLMLAF